MLPPEALEEFKGLYKKRFGEDLSSEDASRRANNLVNLYKLVYVPLESSNESEQRVNQAHDVLFDEIARKGDRLK